MTASYEDVIERAPLFCCCEFVDRHGRMAHLSDASCCDDAAHSLCECSSPKTWRALADCDDRFRLPAFNGAIYIGVEGALPLLMVPMLLVFASGSLPGCALLAAAAPALAALHRVIWCSRRRRSRRTNFFLSWSACSLVCIHMLFTCYVGEHVWFAAWLLVTGCQVAAGWLANMTVRMGGRPSAEQRLPLRASAETGSSDDAETSVRCDDCKQQVEAAHGYRLLLDAWVPEDSAPSYEGALVAFGCGCALTATLTLHHICEASHVSWIAVLSNILLGSGGPGVEGALAIYAAAAGLSAVCLLIQHRLCAYQ